MTRIKLCGLTRPEDVAAVNLLLPEYAGFIVECPGSRRSLKAGAAAALVLELDKRIRAVAVLVQKPIEEALRIARTVKPDALQLHGGEDEDYLNKLRSELRAGAYAGRNGQPIQLIKSFVLDSSLLAGLEARGKQAAAVSMPTAREKQAAAVSMPTARGKQAAEIDMLAEQGNAALSATQTDTEAYAVKKALLAMLERSSADLILVDAGAGSGRSFDWSLIKGLQRPYLLAGGLNAENLPQAIRRLAPWGVDISSGAETDGVKDEAKLRRLVELSRQRIS